MKILDCLCVMVIIAKISKKCYSLSADVNNNTNKKLKKQVKQDLGQKSTKICKNDSNKFEELEKEMLRKIRKLEVDIQVLQQRTNLNFKTCKVQPDNICSPCLYRGDERLLKKILSRLP